MLKNTLRLASCCISFAMLTTVATAADNSSFLGATPPPEGATITDNIGDAADALFGVWKGNLLGRSTPCELDVSDYYAGYSGDTSPNPETVRLLLFTVSSSESGPHSSLQLTDEKDFMAQKDRNLILIDQSQSNDGFGAILRQYSKISLALANGQPQAARAESGSIRFSVIVEKDVDVACVNLHK